MNKKETANKKPKKKENTVEDIYGVHFQYQDLFTRLLKVQKQRRHSEIKSPVISLPSFDTIDLNRNNSSKAKTNLVNGKRVESRNRLKTSNKERSTSSKKILTRHPQTERKNDIFKSFSPCQKTKKSSVHLKSSTKKKLEKKNSSQLRTAKKQALKPKNAA